MQERPKSLEGELERRLIRQIREKGADDPETKRLLDEWTKAEENKVPISQPERTKGAILFNVNRARLYAKVGWIEAARENYEDVLVQLGNLANRGWADQVSNVVYDEMDALP